MNNKKGTVDQEAGHSTNEPKENWPRRLNRILIGVGVVAFGLIIADRLVSMYKTEDSSSSSIAVLESSQNADDAAVEEIKSDTAITIGDATPIERDEEVGDLQSEFGSRLLFVSVADPKYIITLDERRFDIGSSIDEQTTLVGITDNQITLEKAGNLETYDLPEPVTQ